MKLSRSFCILSFFFALAGCKPGVDPDAPQELKPSPGATVYGKVTCDGIGIPGIVVSDGYEVVETDSDGIYNIPSSKTLKYVFISIPSGYEVTSDGVIPRFSARLSQNPSIPERADFELFKTDQSNYTMLFFGDMHLASRSFCHDIEQFRDFAADVNSYMSSHKGKYYAVTLGDMSWDRYWSSNGYDLNNYLQEVNKDFKGLQFFHTMGNHDNDISFSGDFDGASTYRKIIGPTYYSFNIGQIHYIVLDSIEYLNTPEGESNYNTRISDEQIGWLVKDLSHVDRNTPIVVAMHSPLYRKDGSSALGNLWDFIKNFDGFERVQVVSGHSHVVYNVDMLQRSIHIYENNSGAVCGSLWMTGCNYPGLHIGTDGAPGGYRVMDVKGKDMTSFFKATGWPESHQFRVYDSVNDQNEILVNVWDYDPSWTVSVTENGKELPVAKLQDALDPLYIVAYEEYQVEHGYSVSYHAVKTDHIFRTTASSPTSTIEVKVKDRFGRTYTETVSRPKKFTPEEYMNK